MNSQHLIQRQFLEIEFDNPEDAFGLQNRVAELFYERVQPRMDELFEELFGKNSFVTVDNLKIDCGVLEKKNWEHEFVEFSIRRLKEELLQLNNGPGYLRKTESENASEGFFFFLENGFFPWNIRHQSLAELEKHVIINKDFLSRFKKTIRQRGRPAERFVARFSEKFVFEIIEMLAGDRFVNPDEIFQVRQKFITMGQGRKKIDMTVLKVLAGIESEHYKASDILQIEKNIETVISERPGTNEVNESEIKKKQEKITEKKEEEIYVANAGLVIIHPYISLLFEQLKFTNENKWVDDPSRHTAVSVLEFLATGKEEFAEFDLPLNKVLCGLNPDDVVNLPVKIDEDVKMECENLLAQVIEHWKALKNTSADGLRETFVQRRGRLSRVYNGWLLQVEPKGVDILLGSLPWGVGSIKLPWMHEMITVEWT